MDRYTAIETSEGWQVRDTEDSKTLLGTYSEAAARRTAMRLNCNINLSPNEMRCMKRLGNERRVSFASLGNTFRNSLAPGAYEAGKRVADTLVSHRLAEVNEPGELDVTDWGLQWLGLPVN